MSATKLHQHTNRAKKEREITTLIARELFLAWLALLQVLSLARCLLSLQVSAACSRRGGDRTLPCLELVPSPQFLVRSPLSGLESFHLLSPLQRKKKRAFAFFFPGCFVSAFLFLLFSHIHILFFSLACFRSVSYREREQKRREKALGFLEHE